jgi:hypothetical protein
MTKKLVVSCSLCGKNLLKKPSEIFNKNFCNLECKRKYQIKNAHLINQHLKKQVKLRCENCGYVFEVPQNRAKTAKYCSKKCLGQANGKRGKVTYKRRIVINCSNCGNQFEKKPSEIKNLNFCKVSCMATYYSETKMFAGDKSGTWAGGDINYYGPNWLCQRRKARERDNYTCQDCGIPEKEYGKELSVHHIVPFRSFNGDWNNANKLSNLVTLCEYPCHRKRHSKIIFG